MLYNGIIVNTMLKQFTNGQSLHGISVSCDNVEIPFNIKGYISYFSISFTTEAEKDDSRWIHFTREKSEILKHNVSGKRKIRHTKIRHGRKW